MRDDIYIIYEDIQKKIKEDYFVADQRISEKDLMELYNCSRSLIRTIISWCVLNNIFIVKPKSGTYVKKETRRSFREKIEVRTYLEKLACRLLTEYITEERLNKLFLFVEAMEVELNQIPFTPDNFSSIHYDFHYSLVQFSDNKFLLSSFMNLNLRHSYLFAEGGLRDVRVLFKSNLEHRNIVEAIKNRDYIKAEEVVDEHLWVHKIIPSHLELDDDKVER